MAAPGWPTSKLRLTTAGKPIPIGTLKSIIEGSKLSADDFR